jgi:predicted nucleic acid-binding Zn ribbon protein
VRHHADETELKERSEGQNFPVPIGPTVEKVLSEAGLNKLVQARRVFQLWNKVVGPSIKRHAQPRSLRHGTLIVNVDSSVWLAQLDRYFKKRLKEKLNREVGKPLVKKIVFVSGESAPVI